VRRPSALPDAGIRADPRVTRAPARAARPTPVTGGPEAGLEQARAAAGDKNVGIWANIMRQYLKAGLMDEMQIHLVAVLLGEGVPLFDDLGTEPIELRRTRLIETRARRICGSKS
jgi:dihydrofolate reductase